MKLIFMGTPDFAVPILEALHEKYEIVLVISQPNKIKKKNTFFEKYFSGLSHWGSDMVILSISIPT